MAWISGTVMAPPTRSIAASMAMPASARGQSPLRSSTVSAPSAFSASALPGLAIACGTAPITRHSWISAVPTPPEAPVTSTCSPAATPAEVSM